MIVDWTIAAVSLDNNYTGERSSSERPRQRCSRIRAALATVNVDWLDTYQQTNGGTATGPERCQLRVERCYTL
jgi:hypothetical protein